MTTAYAKPQHLSPVLRGSLYVGAALCMAVLFIAPLKFGVIMIEPAEKALEPPHGLMEWILFSFPNTYAVKPMFAVAFACVAAMVLGLTPIRKSRSILAAGLGWVALVMGIAVADKSMLVREWADNPVKIQFALYGTFYLASALLLARPKLRDAAVIILITSGILVSLEALRQYCGGLDDMRQRAAEQADFASFAAFTNSVLSASPPDPGKLFLIKKLASNRVFGTLVYPNALGGFLLIMAPLCAGLLASMRTPLARILACMGLAAALIALLLTRSKACIGLAGAGFITLAFLAYRTGQLSRRMLLAISLVSLVATAGMLAWGYGSGLGERLKSTGGARLDYWRAAGKMIAKNPMRGWGTGAYGRNYVMYARKGAEPTKLTHNAPLNLWVDYGFLGFAGCLMALGIPALAGIVRAARKSQFDWLAASCAVAGMCFFLHTLVDFDFHIIGIMLPGMFALAVGQMGGASSVSAASASGTGVR